MWVANTLARAGYFSGNPQTVLDTDGGIVLDTYNYEMYCRQYDFVQQVLNSKVK